MNSEVRDVVAIVIATFGGTSAIVLALSHRLGQIWADRLMNKERQKYAKELEELRDSLGRATALKLTEIQAQIDVAKQAIIKDHADRIQIYRGSVEVVAEILAKVVAVRHYGRAEPTAEESTQIEEKRLRAYGYLAMHAPQSVMDAYDALIDRLFEVLHDGKDLDWPVMREAALSTLNEIRRDIGIQQKPVAYHGNR